MSIEAIIQSFIKQLEGKDEIIKALLKKIESLEKSNGELTATIKEQNASIRKMAGDLSKMQRMLFGTSSEKRHRETDNEGLQRLHCLTGQMHG